MENGFGEFLKEKRVEKNLTQKELAKILFVSESAVSKWEKNVARPDIALLPLLAETLGVTEHELITASVDKQTREEKNQAKRWRTLSTVCNIFLVVSYLAALVVCFVCNLAINKTLSWFWIVLASLILAFSITNLPKYIKKQRLVFIPLSFYLSICLLLLVCSIYTGGRWFFVASISVLVGMAMIFTPIYIAKLECFSRVRKHNAFITLGVDFLLTNILLLSIFIYTVVKGLAKSNWYLTLGLPISALVYLVFALFVSVKFLRTNRLVKTGVVFYILMVISYLTSAGSYIYYIDVFALLAVCAVFLTVGGIVHFRELKQNNEKNDENGEGLMKKRDFLAMVAAGAGLIVLLFSLFGCSTKEYVTRTYELNEDFDNISLHIRTADANFVLSDDGKCKVVCKEPENYSHKVYVENGCLNIEADDSRKWHQKLFDFGTSDVTVYLPEASFKSLIIENTTGDVDISSGFSFESVNIAATTGDIDISGIDCSGDLDAEVTTGDIEISRVSCGNFRCESTTGDIEMSGVVAEGRFSIKATTGDVKLYGCDADEVYIKSTTGDVTAEFLTEKIVYADTTTGDVDVPRGNEGGPCEIETTTGDVKVTIK